MEIFALCGSVAKSCLQSVDNNLPVDAQMGIAGVSAGILVELLWVVQWWEVGSACIAVDVESLWKHKRFVRFRILVAEDMDEAHSHRLQLSDTVVNFGVD